MEEQFSWLGWLQGVASSVVVFMFAVLLMGIQECRTKVQILNDCDKHGQAEVMEQPSWNVTIECKRA